MSVRILKDVEEALLRQFTSILYSDLRTQTYEVLQSSFDPFTGEKISGAPLQGRFYDSQADARNIEYPHVFIKVLRSSEDRTSGRIVPPYGKEVNTPVASATRAFKVVTALYDTLRTSGNTVTTSTLKIRSVNNTQLLRILSGQNAGTYRILSVTLNGNGPHTITLDSKLLVNLPKANFKLATKTLTFLSPVDLNTVAAGDIFTDSASTPFVITGKDVVNNVLVLETTGPSPSVASGSFISRSGNVLPVVDVTPESSLVLDPAHPVVGLGMLNSTDGNTDQTQTTDWSIPLDIYFGITIDTKNRDDHVAVFQRVWEEFNPPRRGLEILVRNAQSAESFLAENITAASSNQIKILDVSPFIVGQIVRIYNKLTIGFETQIIGINSDTNTLMLADPVPNSYTVQTGTNILSNADLMIWEWDSVSHRDNSNDGSSYWSWVYEYLVQVWVDKKDGEAIVGTIKQIQVAIEDPPNVQIDSIKVP